jgi:hypothetical protein
MFDSFISYLELLLAIGTLFLTGWFFTEFNTFKKELLNKPIINEEGNKLKLQALERLTLFTERAGLKSMVERLENNRMTVAEINLLLTANLKAEYEYNMSQQLYVSPEVWHAITRLKDQNIYIINHITSNLAPNATGLDLCKMIVEYSMTPNAEMNIIVLDALQFEAKKILN